MNLKQTDKGIYIKNNFGLGFVRLSILDLSSAGHQPMFCNENRFVIIFNGEVYNIIVNLDMSCTKDHKEGVDPKKKGPLDKLKESLDDKEEQLEILGTFIRLGVMVWAGFIISLNYITFF